MVDGPCSVRITVVSFNNLWGSLLPRLDWLRFDPVPQSDRLNDDISRTGDLSRADGEAFVAGRKVADTLAAAAPTRP